MAHLTGKLMETKLKYGWTLKEFSNCLQVPEDEVVRQINATFSSKAAKAMLKRIEKNKNFREKAIKSRQKASTRNTFKMPEQKVETSPEEILKQRENELINSVVLEEKAYKELTLNKHELKKALFEEKKELIKIQKEVEERKIAVQEIISSLLQTEEKIEKEKIRLRDYNSELNKIQSELRELHKLVIYVYDSGIIEAEDYNFEEIDYQSKYSEIMEKEGIIENLTLRQCKQLSKLLAFVETIDREIELVFDSGELQKVYQSFTS